METHLSEEERESFEDFLNFLRGMETVWGQAPTWDDVIFLNFLRGMETAMHHQR